MSSLRDQLVSLLQAAKRAYDADEDLGDVSVGFRDAVVEDPEAAADRFYHSDFLMKKGIAWLKRAVPKRYQNATLKREATMSRPDIKLLTPFQDALVAAGARYDEALSALTRLDDSDVREKTAQVLIDMVALEVKEGQKHIADLKSERWRREQTPETNKPVVREAVDAKTVAKLLVAARKRSGHTADDLLRAYYLDPKKPDFSTLSKTDLTSLATDLQSASEGKTVRGTELYEQRRLSGLEPANHWGLALHENVGETIVKQLGGANKLRAMLGAKFAVLPNGVIVQWPSRHRSRGNQVEITLRSDDTYDVLFYNASASGRKLVRQYNGLYAEDLIPTFEDQTGYRIRL